MLSGSDKTKTGLKVFKNHHKGSLTSISKSVSPKAARNNEQKCAIDGTSHQFRISASRKNTMSTTFELSKATSNDC